jgi:polar amino acid transport system permease protein
MQEYLTAIGDALPYLLQGSLVTMGLVAGAMALGLALGVVLAVGLVYGPRYVRRLFNLYVWFFRGVPLLVLLFLFIWALHGGINISAFSAAASSSGYCAAPVESSGVDPFLPGRIEAASR